MTARRPSGSSAEAKHKYPIGDKAYDSAELRVQLQDLGTKLVTPNRSCRKQPFSFNKRLYKRSLIENAFSRLKDFRRIATRYLQTGAHLPRLYLPGRSAGMVDLMSLDPS